MLLPDSAILAIPASLAVLGWITILVIRNRASDLHGIRPETGRRPSAAARESPMTSCARICTKILPARRRSALRFCRVRLGHSLIRLEALAATPSRINSIRAIRCFPTSIPYQGFYPIPPDLRTTEQYSWNLGIQRQVTPSLFTSATYVGTHLIHTWSHIDLNPAQFIAGNCAEGQYGLTAAGPCSTSSNINQRRILNNPLIGSVTQTDDGGTQSYNGLLLSATMAKRERQLGGKLYVVALHWASHQHALQYTVHLSAPALSKRRSRGAEPGRGRLLFRNSGYSSYRQYHAGGKFAEIQRRIFCQAATCGLDTLHDLQRTFRKPGYVVDEFRCRHQRTVSGCWSV